MHAKFIEPKIAPTQSLCGKWLVIAVIAVIGVIAVIAVQLHKLCPQCQSMYIIFLKAKNNSELKKENHENIIFEIFQ